MKKTKLYPLAATCIILYVMIFSYGCGKSAAVTPKVKEAGNGSPQVIYMMGDTLGSPNAQLWSVATDGTGNKKIAITIPANLHFVLYSDIAAEVSPDSKSMVLSLRNSDETIAYFYKCNIDGSGLQKIPNANGEFYLQTYINASSVLYWKDVDSHHNGELWRINTDGTGNQKINISLPDNVGFGDGKFAKVTADGKTIFFSTFSSGVNINQTSIYKCNIDGSGLKLITSDYNSGIQALVNNTSILDYVANSSTDEGGYWLLNLDGTNKRLVLYPPSPLIFSDSKVEVVNNTSFFVAEDGHSTQAIYSDNLDGSNVNKLVTKIPPGYAVRLQGVIQ
ncbi:MAG: DUF5050 domain-containing protein [Bacteroidota bacterium]|nr:DUF5050 domain-containing protein [Bacteroidota bacterium]